MSSIVNFDRDLTFLNNLGRPQVFFCNQQPIALSLKTTSDGILYNDYACLSYYAPNVVFALSSTYCRCLGLHIIGPDLTGGSPYRLKGFITSEQDYNVSLMYGVGPSTITTLAAGDTIVGSQPIGTSVSSLYFDETVYLNAFDTLYPGQSYTERPATFFIMVHRPAHIAAIDSGIYFNLSVQRLSVKPPVYITANR